MSMIGKMVTQDHLGVDNGPSVWLSTKQLKRENNESIQLSRQTRAAQRDRQNPD
jgi:hypothetical protein